MALRRLLADPYTRAELGEHGLAELSRNLWPGSCLTCGEPLTDEHPPAVLVVDTDIAVTASLRHPGCQRPCWTRRASGMLDRYVSTTVGFTTVPFGDPGSAPFLPTVLANPSLEQVSLARDNGHYRATTITEFQTRGLRPSDPSGMLPPSGDGRTVCCWLTETHLIVRCAPYYWVLHIDGVRDPRLAEVHQLGGVVLGVGTALNPPELVNPEPIKRVIAAGDLALILAPLAQTTPPDLDAHSIEVDSAWSDADEQDDAAWLSKVEYYRGPSYDPATGQFAVGMGMDGPSYWTLAPPGDGVANGLVAGPAGCGKTNSLRILLVELLSSGVLLPSIADPLNRNGLVGQFGEAATVTADSADGHWGSTHASVGEVRAVSSSALTPEQARDWAVEQISSNGGETLIEWGQPRGDPHSWFTLDALSVEQYCVRREQDGWTCLQILSRIDGDPGDATTVQEWATRAVRVHGEARILDWVTAATTEDGFTTLHGSASPR